MDCSYIRSGGGYKTVGIISLFPTIVCPIIAAQWKPSWSWWTYWVTVLPNSLAYSFFLCTNLLALVGAVDSRVMVRRAHQSPSQLTSQPKATALLYTVRTLGGTLGVSFGGALQLGALTNGLRARFTRLGLSNTDELITSILHSKAAIAKLPENLRVEALDAYAMSISITWIACASIGLVTLVGACLTKEKDMGHDERRKSVVPDVE